MDGPEILVMIFDPCQQLFFSTTMGRGVLPDVPDLGGEGNPTEVGKWTVSFRVTDPGTLASDFGGISVNGTVLRTLVVDTPIIGEQQQVVFGYPFG